MRISVKLAAVGLAAAAGLLLFGAAPAQAAPPGSNSLNGVPVGKVPQLPLGQLPLGGKLPLLGG
jgi:hypothetical protein